MDPQFKHVSSDPDFWDSINEKFFRKYSGIDRTHKQWAEQVITGQALTGPTGRRWPISMGVDGKGNPKVPWTTLTNYPVQGTAQDIMAVARISLMNRLKLLGNDILLISTVHDSIVCDVPKDKVDITAKLMYDVFKDLPANFAMIFGYKMKVPYACEVKVGYNLTEMETYVTN